MIFLAKLKDLFIIIARIDLMSNENKICTINIKVQNETFEVSSSLYNQLVEFSSSSDLYIVNKENENSICLNVDPSIFNNYLLYIQSGCFIRPNNISKEDLINNLDRCGAPSILINHYKYFDLISALSTDQYSSHPIKKLNHIEYKWLNIFILIGLFISTCVLTIDLYRQILILNKNFYQEKSLLLIIIIYSVDGLLFLYSFFDGILKYILKSNKRNEFRKKIDLIIDIISCTGILCYFIIQRPITNINLTPLNSLWIFIHLCRTIRLLEIGYHLIDIQWCLYAITECFSTFIQSILALFWLFIHSGSILYLIDIIEENHQYPKMYLTILSSHETLYTIGYRNNAPYGCLTRIWTTIIIYFMTSIVQILLWLYQTEVSIQWKILLDKQKES